MVYLTILSLFVITDVLVLHLSNYHGSCSWNNPNKVTRHTQPPGVPEGCVQLSAGLAAVVVGGQ